MAQLLEGLKNILSWISQLISFPIHMWQLLTGMPGTVTSGIWWLPLEAIGIIVSILVLAILLKVFRSE